MNLHEYQAKHLLRQCGVPLLPGGMACTPEEAVALAHELGGNGWVVKAQIHAGGRGKAGGIRVVTTQDAVHEAAQALLGTHLITAQTGPEGLRVDRVYIEALTTPVYEMYLAFLVDRRTCELLAVASRAGGVDIEETARRDSQAVRCVVVDPDAGLNTTQLHEMATFLEIPGQVASGFSTLMQKLFQAVVQYDAVLLEINPAVMDTAGRFWALDAKMSIDENALFRQPQIKDFADPQALKAKEEEAQLLGFNYIQLQGTIGCLVNGAGLAMATMDLIQQCGARPANFLDIGGGATRERVAAALKMTLSDPAVRCVLINIFGGIMRCDLVAQGILDVAAQGGLRVPCVVRLVGTNAQAGKELLLSAGLAVQWANDFAQAAEMAVRLAKEGSKCQF